MNTQPYLAAAAAAEAAGRWSEAEAHYRRALQISPAEPAILRAAAIANFRLGKLAPARKLIERAIRLSPHPELLLVQAGLAAAAGDWPAGIAACQQALQIAPNEPTCLLELGMLHMRAGQPEEAEQTLRAALRAKPDMVQAAVNLADVLTRRDALDEAQSLLREVLDQTKPGVFGRAQAWSNLGAVLRKAEDVEGARAAYQAAINEAPDYAPAHRDLGLLRLLLGEYAEGYAEYTWRWRSAERGAPPLPGPRWNGTALPGSTVVLHFEQGFGDTIQFLRYVPEAARRVRRVVVAVPPPLLKLVRSSLPGLEVVAPDRLPRHDAHAYLMDLPLLLGMPQNCQPEPIPYLTPPPDRAAFWARALAPGAAAAGPCIGLVWAGNSAHGNDARRSLDAASLASLVAILSDVPGARLFALQPQAACPAGVARLPAAHGDFADAAAAVAAMDLVISVDTAAAHLAGALGRPVWMLLPRVPDWRWGLQGETTTWYPSMRLFRQAQAGDWAASLAALKAALAAQFSAPSPR